MFKKFIDRLSKRESTDTVYNPYTNPKIANNLRLYLEYLFENTKNDILLIGEAPGHRGCRITGIPFTSGETIINSKLDFFQKNKDDIFLSKIESETTATIVYELLERKNKLPIFWNSFPFHPYNLNNNTSNRAPNNEEIEEGKVYIQELVSLFNPSTIAAIGRKGEKTLKNIFPDNNIQYIRHPSHGGKNHFISGMELIL